MFNNPTSTITTPTRALSLHNGSALYFALFFLYKLATAIPIYTSTQWQRKQYFC